VKIWDLADPTRQHYEEFNQSAKRKRVFDRSFNDKPAVCTLNVTVWAKQILGLRTRENL